MPEIKINHPGLRLRGKSPVHAKIIDEKIGRRKKDVVSLVENQINYITLRDNYLDKNPNSKEFKSLLAEHWQYNGHKISEFQLKTIIIDYKLISKRFNKNYPLNIFVIGPGKGSEVHYLNNLFKDFKHKAIDTIGLTDYLSKSAKKITKNDYSPKKLSNLTTFEHFNHLNLIGKYDYIYSQIGPGYHTNHPGIVILKVASMLKPNGLARIELNPNKLDQTRNNLSEYLSIININKEFKFNFEIHDNDYAAILISRIK